MVQQKTNYLEQNNTKIKPEKGYCNKRLNIGIYQNRKLKCMVTAPWKTWNFSGKPLIR